MIVKSCPIMILCLVAALGSACATRPAVTATRLPPTVFQAAEAAAFSTLTLTNAPTATATALPTATTTPTPTLAPSPTATIPVPLAAAAYLRGARVLDYDPLDRQNDKSFVYQSTFKGDVRFEDGRMITIGHSSNNGGWLGSDISFYDIVYANTAILIQFKRIEAAYYFVAEFSRTNTGIGMVYSNVWGPEPNLYGKISNELTGFSSNYPIWADEWNSLLLAIGKDGSFRAMVIDPQRPQRFACWEKQKPEWADSGWNFNITNNSGTLELKEFMLIQFDGFEKCFK